MLLITPCPVDQFVVSSLDTVNQEIFRQENFADFAVRSYPQK